MAAELDTTDDGHVIREHVSSNVIVRRATIEDLSIVTDFAFALEQGLLHHDTTRRRISHEGLFELHAKRLRDEEPEWRYTYHIAEQDGVPVGFIFGKAPHPQKSYDFTHLQGIHVVENARKTGVAEALVRQFVETAEERGVGHVIANVYIGSRGHGFFARLGWHATLDPLNQQMFHMTMPGR